MARRFQKLTAGYYISSLGRTDSSPVGGILIGKDWAIHADGIMLLEIAPNDVREPGDPVATGMTLTVGPLVGTVIRVTGQAVAEDGSLLGGVRTVHLKTVSIGGIGTPTMAVVTGANLQNLGSELWMDTNAQGVFAVDVTDVTLETVILSVVLDDGITEFTKLDFT